MIDQFQYQFLTERTVHHHCIPVYFAHVVTGPDGRILFTQFNGPFRIAFQRQAPVAIEVGEGKHFTHHFENQRGLIKRKLFGYPGFGHAIIPDFFDVHSPVIFTF